MNSIITDRTPQLVELCKKYRVTTMYLFGSAATEKFNKETSDIDILISLSKDLSMEEYADNYLDLAEALEALFGIEVDLVTERSLSDPGFIASVERSKQLIYAA